MVMRHRDSAWDRLDAAFIRFMASRGLPLLRVALAVVFIWFGLLKVIGRSPVVDLVARTVYWVSPEFFVPFLGVWEGVGGLGLLFAVALPLPPLLLFLPFSPPL